MLIVYVLVGIIWGLFAVAMQKKIYPTRSDKRDLALNFIVNGIIWPVSMTWATICFIFQIGWAKNL